MDSMRDTICGVTFESQATCAVTAHLQRRLTGEDLFLRHFPR
jgi:hypothetical protein